MTRSPIKFVEIGGWRLEIRATKDQDVWGKVDEEERIIWISPEALKSKRAFRETLRHELDHVARIIGGIYYNETHEEEAIARNRDHIFWPAWEKLEKRLK